jgi:hypothetical protein
MENNTKQDKKVFDKFAKYVARLDSDMTPEEYAILMIDERGGFFGRDYKGINILKADIKKQVFEFAVIFVEREYSWEGKVITTLTAAVKWEIDDVKYDYDIGGDSISEKDLSKYFDDNLISIYENDGKKLITNERVKELVEKYPEELIIAVEACVKGDEDYKEEFNDDYIFEEENGVKEHNKFMEIYWEYFEEEVMMGLYDLFNELKDNGDMNDAFEDCGMEKNIDEEGVLKYDDEEVNEFADEWVQENLTFNHNNRDYFKSYIVKLIENSKLEIAA